MSNQKVNSFEPRLCEVCKKKIQKDKKTTLRDYQKKRFCSRECYNQHRKQNPQGNFDRKAYMKKYVKKYRQKKEVKEKRKIEAKQNYQRQRAKISAQRLLQKSKQEKLNEPKNFIKYIRKDLEIKRYREASKENKQSRRTHFTIILDTCDYGLLLILSKQSNLQIYELSEIIGLSQVNLHNHLTKLISLNLISCSQEIKGDKLKRRWTKVYSLTKLGNSLLRLFGFQMKNFTLEDNDKRKAEEGRKEARKMLLEVLENE